MRKDCPRPEEGCKYFPDCFADLHHPDYPRKAYTSSLEKRYRSARAAGNYLCRAEHEEIHATEPIPVKPSPDEMRAFLSNVVMEEPCTENINTLPLNTRHDLAS